VRAFLRHGRYVLGENPVTAAAFALFVALVLALVQAWRVLQIRWPRWVQMLPGYTVGVLGAFWTIQRVALMVAAWR